MVIVKIIGGLGNQLFQYAAARRLSLLHQTPLKLDTISFENYAWHAYSLKPFNIQEIFATPEEIVALTGSSKKGIAKLAFRLNRKLKASYRHTNFDESCVRPYDPNILKTPKQVYLNGYWQDERYFADIQDIIRHEFTIKYEQDEQSQEIARMIDATQSVSIHIRRGNFVSNPEVSQVHGTCSLDYYQQCVRRISEKISRPHFFIFSDEPSWAKENLRLEYPMTFVDHNDAARDYEDLRLMSLCKHQIIANSTFSWWAAWLNPNANKMVFAPQKWFNASYDTSSLIPEGWIKI